MYCHTEASFELCSDGFLKRVAYLFPISIVLRSDTKAIMLMEHDFKCIIPMLFITFRFILVLPIHNF